MARSAHGCSPPTSGTRASSGANFGRSAQRTSSNCSLPSAFGSRGRTFRTEPRGIGMWCPRPRHRRRAGTGRDGSRWDAHVSVAAPEGGVQILPGSLRRGTPRHSAGHGHGHRQDRWSPACSLLGAAGAARADLLPAARRSGVDHPVRTPRRNPRGDRRRSTRTLAPSRGRPNWLRDKLKLAQASGRSLYRGHQLRLSLARAIRGMGREGQLGSGHRGRGPQDQSSRRQGVAVLQAPASADATIASR